STLNPGPRYLAIVLALAGDSTMTRSCLRDPERAGASPGSAFLRPRPAGRVTAVVFAAFAAVAFLRPVAGAPVVPSVAGFLRVGTGTPVAKPWAAGCGGGINLRGWIGGNKPEGFVRSSRPSYPRRQIAGVGDFVTPWRPVFRCGCSPRHNRYN